MTTPAAPPDDQGQPPGATPAGPAAAPGDPAAGPDAADHPAAPADAAPPPDPAQRQRQIGIWGAPASGKSTFLSSLFIATTRATERVTVRGNDATSTAFLVTNTNLMQNHEFPPPTVLRARLSWTLQIWVRNTARRSWRRLWRRRPREVPFDFNVEIQDAGGLDFGAEPLAPGRLDISGQPTEDIATYLRRCQGLLIIIDPLREREVGDAYRFFFGPLLRMAESQPMPLQHYVAVCVTKFDHPRVFDFAQYYGYLAYRIDDPEFMPRVRPDEAEGFMRHLFQDPYFQDHPTNEVEMIIGGLRQYFRPERVKYFISSAIGFYMAPMEPFSEENYMNVSDNATGPKIVGAVRPINVIEPLTWLGERLAAGEP
jgi:hypothetical protein